MTLFIRITSVIILIYSVQIAIIGHIYYESRQLALFGNLPHRYLGGLFWCQHLQPQREDYAYTYLVEWLLADKEQRIIEGQHSPIIPKLAIKKATVDFPRDEDLQAIRYYMLRDHFNKKSSFQKFGKTREEELNPLPTQLE